VEKLDLPVDVLVDGILEISRNEPVALLDSCGSPHLDSRFLLAGIAPVKTISLQSDDTFRVLAKFNEFTSDRSTSSIFTISYGFGMKLLDIPGLISTDEPDIYAHVFESLIVHDYTTGETSITGNKTNAKKVVQKLRDAAESKVRNRRGLTSTVVSNFSEAEYLERIAGIQAEIRRGNTYQTNLTQQFTVSTHPEIEPQIVFNRLRSTHPAAFAAFIARERDHVISISPERFIKISPANGRNKRMISSSPIKGTRKRGKDEESDDLLKKDLLTSPKDRAENTMIVDLIRNDLGKVCEYGSIVVEKLCGLEEHPTLFHLVSTVIGELRETAQISDVLKAVFPCGSITGCPKISTMKIIGDLETVPRGLSMGAIGYAGFDNSFDLSVAIRTLVFDGRKAVFNVGGGIVIDSDPDAEYRESLLKAKALFDALDVER